MIHTHIFLKLIFLSCLISWHTTFVSMTRFKHIFSIPYAQTVLLLSTCFLIWLISWWATNWGWNVEIWSLFLFFSLHVKVERLFSCAGCTSKQSHLFRTGTFHPIPRKEIVPRSVLVKSPCYSYSLMSCWERKFLFAFNLSFFSSGSLKFPNLQPRLSSNSYYFLYSSVFCFRPEHAYNIWHWT